MAVASGVADVVVCYRAFNERSGHRFGAGVADRPAMPTPRTPSSPGTRRSACSRPACWVAMFAQRYLHATGATTEDFGRVAVADRRHAATNPKAWFYEKPITLEDHQARGGSSSRCACSTAARRPTAARPSWSPRSSGPGTSPSRRPSIRAAAQGSWHGQDMMTSYYRDDMARLPEMGLVARQLWETAGLGPADIQTAILYDHFTPFVLYHLEEFGFCGWGEAKDFVADGNIEIGGRLPINTHGGQLGEAYIHGMNGIAEGVRQVRGTSVNQVAGVEHVVVTAGTGVPTSGLILGVDR